MDFSLHRLNKWVSAIHTNPPLSMAFCWQPEETETCPLHFLSISGVCDLPDWIWVAFFLTNTLIFFILCIGHLAHNRHSTTPGSLYWMLLYFSTAQWIHRQADLFLNIPWDFAITFLVMSSSLTLKVTVITHLDSPPSCSLSVKFLFLSCNHFIVCVFFNFRNTGD